MGYISIGRHIFCHRWTKSIYRDVLYIAGYAYAQIAKELKITPILDKLLWHKRNWIQHVDRMPRNRLPRVMKHYCPTGRRNCGWPLKRLLDTWDWNGSTSGPTAWKIYDDDDDDDTKDGPPSPCSNAVRTSWMTKFRNDVQVGEGGGAFAWTARLLALSTLGVY